MDEPQKHHTKKPDTKGHSSCDSIYVQCPKWANPEAQKADQWLPGAGGRTAGKTALVRGNRVP